MKIFQINSQEIRRSVPFALIFFFLLSVVGYGVRSVDWFHAIPGNLGDPRFNSIILEHVHRWLIGDAKNLWSPNFFYPFQNVLAFSDNHLGSVLFYSIFRIIGLSREGAMAAWIVIACALNFISSYWVLRKFSITPFASATAAFLFTSSLPLLGEPNQIQTIYRFAIPLCFYYFWLGINDQPEKLGIAILWLSEQFYCSIYLGVFLSYLLVTIFIACWILEGKKIYINILLKYQMLTTGKKVFFSIQILLGLILIYLLLWKYKSVAYTYDLSWPFWQIDNQLPQVRSYLGPTDFFLGYGLIAGLLVSLIMLLYSPFISKVSGYKDLRLQKILWLSIALLIGFTFKFGDISLYYLLLKIPGISSIRGVYRIIFVLIWPIALVIGIAINQIILILKKKVAKFYLSCFILLILILCSESLFSKKILQHSSFSKWRDRIDKLNTHLISQIPENGVLFVHNRIHEDNALTELDGVILAQDLHRPTLNGFSGHEPPGYRQANLCFSYRDRIAAFQYFSKGSMEESRLLAERLIHLDSNIKDPNLFSYTTRIGVAIDDEYPNPAKLAPNPLYCGWPTLANWENWSEDSSIGLLLPLPIEGDPNMISFEITLNYQKNQNVQPLEVWIDNNLQSTIEIKKGSRRKLTLPIPSSSKIKGWIFIELNMLPIGGHTGNIIQDKNLYQTKIKNITFSSLPSK
jgi:hypothetical protein